MLSIVNRLLKLSGEYAYKLKLAFMISIFEGVMAKVPIILVLYILIRMVNEQVTISDVWIVSVGMTISVILRMIFQWLVDRFQSGTGYEIFARERMKIGNHLKRLPMGYFSEGNIGNITAVVTSDLVFVEEHCMTTLSKVVTGYISTAIGVAMIMFLDYRIGIISLITIILAYFYLRRLEKVVEHHSFIRQETHSRLIGAVLEYVKGISVIKSYNMVGEKAKKIADEFKHCRDASIDFEKKYGPPFFRVDHCFTLGIALTILGTSYFALNQTLDIALLLMLFIFVFELYLPFKVIGGLTPQFRIMEAALNRYDAIKRIDIIDENGKDIELQQFDIEFNNVQFAYEQDTILHNVSFKVLEKSMTALVGKSGCGKSTIVNLITRFWDIQEGEIKIGGINVKELTSDSLLRNISIVFQNVYLFKDSILNNIKLGNPNATMEEVIEACKKARCHEFIMELENSYDTIVGEGGSSLSGGQKQRISIARAILKDAPIILLDEATASIDPDNERYIQLAINELVKNKTLIIIAHKLSTIKNADQIVVLDKGRIVQKGTHQSLIEQEGQYYNLWEKRKKARGWKINKVVS